MAQVTTLLTRAALVVGLFENLNVSVSKLMRSLMQKKNKIVLIGACALGVMLLQGTILALFQGSEIHWRHVFGLLRYWGAFMLFGGLLALSGEKELNKFVTTYSLIAGPMLLIYIPLEVLDKFFQAVYSPVRIRLGYGALNPNTLGYFSAVAGVCSVVGIYDKRGLVRAALILSWLITGTIVLLTQSRGAGVAWVFGSATSLWFIGKEYARVPIYTLAAVILLVVIADRYVSVNPPTVKARWRELSKKIAIWQSRSVQGRIETIEHILYRGQKNLLLGNGFGVPLIVRKDVHGATYLQGSHVLLLDLFCEVGIVGLSLFVTAVCAMLIGFFRALGGKNRHDRSRNLAFAMGLSALLLVEHNLSGGIYGAAWLALLLGFLSAKGFRLNSIRRL